MAGLISKRDSTDIYGGMYIENNANATSIATTQTWTDVGNFVEGDSSNVNYGGNELVVVDDGSYLLSWAASTSAQTINDVFRIGVSINNSAPLNNTIIERKYGNNDVGASAGSAILVLNAGDVINMKCYNNTSAGNITFKWANLIINKL